MKERAKCSVYGELIRVDRADYKRGGFVHGDDADDFYDDFGTGYDEADVNFDGLSVHRQSDLQEPRGIDVVRKDEQADFLLGSIAPACVREVCRASRSVCWRFFVGLFEQ